MMRSWDLIQRSFLYYRRIHLAVILGVATAVSVLGGALLVGDSVRGSLRDLFLKRLGNTDDIVLSSRLIASRLAQDLESHPRFQAPFDAVTPLIVMDGVVVHQISQKRAARVRIYGVDQRFWRFHGQEPPPASETEVLLNSRVAEELGADPGDPVLLTVRRPSAVPLEFLHGRRHEVGLTLRYLVGDVLPARGVGEFSIQPGQTGVSAVFVPLGALQRQLGEFDTVNTLLISRRGPESPASAGAATTLQAVLKDTVTLEDLGLRLRKLPQCGCLSLESESTLLDEGLWAAGQAAAERLEGRVQPILTYLANSIHGPGGQIPYSLVSAVDLPLPDAGSSHPLPALWLSDWAAEDLQAAEGEEIALDYYLWEVGGRLVTRTARFRLAGSLPRDTADPDFTPQYQGITDADTVSSWDPPFPIDLSRIRPHDEAYWDRYRTTPKAFVSLAEGRRLWGSRFGDLTSIRIYPRDGNSLEQMEELYRKELTVELDPLRNGFSILPVRELGIRASRGATDFGEFFLYFSFFLVVSALLLAALFFRLGVEQRLGEIGLLRALGFPPFTIGCLFAGEGALPALAGTLLGVMGAWAYGAVMMLGLRTWWFDAVGTSELQLHFSTLSVAIGALAGVTAALLSILWAIRRLLSASPRRLLTGAPVESGTASDGRSAADSAAVSPRRLQLAAAALISLGLLLLLAAGRQWISEATGFFTGGILVLSGLLALQPSWLRNRSSPVRGHGPLALFRLGIRNASFRPNRSLFCIAFVASACFVIVAVEAFRHGPTSDLLNHSSGTGGFPLMAESLLPLPYDPNGLEGREHLNLASPELEPVYFHPFRLKPGDDASCLNLYRPEDPRVLGVGADFIESGRFRFRRVLAESPDESENPWRLLARQLPDGVIPAIGDANSLRYVLHREVGDEITLSSEGRPVRLRIVAALADSLFQGELLISEENFLRAFPGQEGYRFFLVDAPAAQAAPLAALLEDRLSDFGFEVISTADRLAEYHRVENTYLSTFQLLGGLGLLLGTVGLAAVLLRNVLERRRELALLRAMGYRSRHFSLLVLSENAFLLFSGLIIGFVAAMIAIAPALASRADYFPHLPLRLVAAVVLAGLISSLAATVAALRTPLLGALKRE